jgi:hypothetical protein
MVGETNPIHQTTEQTTTAFFAALRVNSGIALKLLFAIDRPAGRETEPASENQRLN